MLNGFDAYQTYLAIKLHFTQKSYSYIKYHGKCKSSVDSYRGRRDTYLFDKLSKKFRDKEELADFMVANYAYREIKYVGDLNGCEAMQAYMRWKKYYQAVQHFFQQDLDNLVSILDEAEMSVQDVFKYNENDPYILNLYLTKKIGIDIITLLNVGMGFIDHWNSKNDMVIGELTRDIVKYQEFLKVDQSQIRHMIKDTFSQRKDI